MESTESRYEIGPLAVRLRRSADELWHAVDRGAEEPSGEDPSVEDPSAEEPAWERWAGADVSAVRFVPALPDRPLVVAPEPPFHLAPRARARVYVRIPLWVQVSFEGAESPLFEVPTVVLSDTWWGDLVSGEMGYWLPISARRQYSPDLFEPHLAMCPLSIQNVSDRTLPVERLAVRVEHLAVYGDGSRLWTNETHVKYEDEPGGSRIEPLEGPPVEAPSATWLGGPRSPSRGGLRALTFGRLKDAVGL